MNRTIIIIAIAMTIIVIIAASPILRQIGGRAPEPCNICGKDSNTCPPDKCDGLSKIIVTTAVTWNQAQALARKNGGRLPTDQEFKAFAVNAGSRDLWMPASHSSGRVNDWVQIGRHAVPRYSYHIPTYGPPRWGLDNHAHAFRPRLNDAFNYIYIMNNSTNDDWVCLKDSMGDINVPIKKVGEDPACLSNNGRDCLWNKGHCKDGQRTTAVLPSTSSIKPLVCGAHHQKQYGSTGYVNPQHWCKRSKDMI